MITIPEYVFQDENIKFKCPDFTISREDAVQMHNVLTNTQWQWMLDKEEYICHAMKELGFDSTLISVTLSRNYNCVALDGCLWVEMGGIRGTRIKIAKIIRKAWCDHMRTYLSTALSRG